MAATAAPDGEIDDTPELDYDSDDDGLWSGAHDQWARIYAAALRLAHPIPGCDVTGKQPTVGTFFSGTEAPVLALQMLANDVYTHRLSCDQCEASRAFTKANFSPEHQFGRVEDAFLESAHCYICGPGCQAFHEKLDFLMAGFPCTPFSGMSNRRWKEGYNPLEHADAAAFLGLRRFLSQKEPVHKTRDSSPHAVLLENVAGVLSRSSANPGAPTAAEQIMNGVLVKPDGKKDIKYGLKFLKGYRVKMFGPLSGKTVGIPFERPRCFWLLLSKARYTEEHLEAWHKNAAYLASRAIKPQPATDYFAAERVSDDADPNDADPSCESGSDSDLAETAGPLRKKQRVALQHAAATFRKAHGLAKFGSAGGHPYSSSASDDIRRRLTARELDVLDSAFLYLQKFEKCIPDSLAVDVSQSPSRMPWRTLGNLPSPIKRSLIWYKGRVLDPATMFYLMGWPQDSLRLPKLKTTEMRALIGNMCCPPQAGLVIAAFLAIHPEFSITGQIPPEQ